MHRCSSPVPASGTARTVTRQRTIAAALPEWVAPQLTQLKSPLVPYPSDEMVCWPASTRVGNVKNNDPSLVEPVASVQSP